MTKPGLILWSTPAMIICKPQRALRLALREEARRGRFSTLREETYEGFNVNLMDKIDFALRLANRPQISIIPLYIDTLNDAKTRPNLERLVDLFQQHPFHGVLVAGLFPSGITRPLAGIGNIGPFLTQARGLNLLFKKKITQARRSMRNLSFRAPGKDFDHFPQRPQGPWMEDATRKTVDYIMEGILILACQMCTKPPLLTRLWTEIVPQKRPRLLQKLQIGLSHF